MGLEGGDSSQNSLIRWHTHWHPGSQPPSPLGGVSCHLDLRALASRLASHPYTQLVEGRCCSQEISHLPSRSAASEMPPLSSNDMDTLSCDSGSSVVSTSCVSSLVPSHHLWVSKSGRHVLGLAEDYDALCEQIGQGQTLLAEMDLQIREAPGPISQELVTKVTSAMALEGEGYMGEQEAEAGGKGAVGPLPLGGGAGKAAPRLGGQVRSAGCVLLWGPPAEGRPRATAIALPHAGLCLSRLASVPLSFGPVACSSVLPPSHWSAPLLASTLSVAEVLILAWGGRIA